MREAWLLPWKQLRESFIRHPWFSLGVVFIGLLSLWSFGEALYRLVYPYSIDYGEGLAKLGAMRFGFFNLAKLYPPVSPTQLVPAAYTPVYYGLCAVLMDIRVPAYFAGRLIAVASALGIGVLIFRVVAAETRDRWVAWLSAIMFFIWAPVYGWFGYMRADFTAIFFAFLGLYLLLHRPKTHIFVVAGCFLLAFMTKDNMVIAPVVAAVVIYKTERWKLRLYLQFYVYVLAALFLIFEIWTGGQFLDQIVNSVEAAINLQSSFNLTQQLLTQEGILCALALWGAVSIRRERAWPWGVYFVLALLFGGWSIGKDGSSVNYFIEPAAAASICMGLAIGRFRQERPLAGGSLAISALLIQLITLIPGESQQTQSDWNALRVNTDHRTALEAIINHAPGDVLTDDPGMVVDSNKTLTIASFEFKLYHENGEMSDQPLADALAAGQYSLAVLSFPVQNGGSYFRFTRATMQAVNDNFHLVGTIHNTPGTEFIYLYNGSVGLDTYVRTMMPLDQGNTQ